MKLKTSVKRNSLIDAFDAANGNAVVLLPETHYATYGIIESVNKGVALVRVISKKTYIALRNCFDTVRLPEELKAIR